nr:lipase family protein [uncultured Rhodopila sp.]
MNGSHAVINTRNKGGGTVPRSYNSETAGLAMTLSTLAYVEENRIATREQMIDEINAGLNQAGYESWKVAWGPALNPDRSNMMYAARNDETGHLAVSIRGSDFSFWLNWIEDLATLVLVPYEEFVPGIDHSAQIARGTAIGLRQLLRMQDGTQSLQAFLATAPEGTPILVTGHSLGGCLAAGLAPCVADWVGGPANLSVYTIAAPSPGNAAFATYYNTLFSSPSGHSTAFRFFNSLDVVPNAWASLGTVETYYPPLLTCPNDITTIIGYAEQAVGLSYRQLGDAAAGSAVELPGTLIPPFAQHRGRLELDPFEDALFLWEAAQQHACTTYQTLLQTPLTLPEAARVSRTLVALRKQGPRIQPLNPQ